ncbi:MAG: c-type cytochrome [Acidobacteria bacterium]|nr:c-type cytochrome [Acidobacteriota bacterium]
MKRFLLSALQVFLAVTGIGFAWLSFRKPNIAPPANVTVDGTPERLARGKYLYNAVLYCDGCHGEKDFTRFGNPVTASGAGFLFPPELGLPGTVSAPNITSDAEAGIGLWTDGEIIRAVREGISRDGRVLFPMMPYHGYRHMSDADTFALIAHMRTIPPSRDKVPVTQINFPVGLMIKGVPQPVTQPVPPADPANKVKYGEYLVTIAACADCHTRMVRGRIDREKLYAGGREFRIGDKRVVSANITPDPETGIGKITEDQWVEKFYQYKDYVRNGPPKVGPEGFTLMPWLEMAQLEEADLRAMYAYLKTVKPVTNAVETHPEAPAQKK